MYIIERYTILTNPLPPMEIPNKVVAPLLISQVASECALKSDAVEKLLAAHTRGSISPQEISALFPASITRDRKGFTASFQKLIQLFRTLNVKVELTVKHVHTHTHVHTVQPPPAPKAGVVAPIQTVPQPVSEPKPKQRPDDHEKIPIHPYHTTPESRPTREGLGLTNTGIGENPSPEELQALEKENNNESFSPADFAAKFIFDKEDRSELNSFYRQAVQHPILEHGELMDLFAKYKDHDDMTAHERIVCHNLRFVLKEATRFLYRGLDFDDLVQEGNIGLLRAVEKFDYRLGFHFTTYARWWVRQNIQRAIADKHHLIREPVHHQEKRAKLWKATQELLVELGREPLLEEIMGRTHLSAKEIRSITQHGSPAISSLEEIVWESKEGNGVTRGDTTPSVQTFSPDLLLITKEELGKEVLAVQKLVGTINQLNVSERHKVAFKSYCGLDGSENVTLEELGQKFGVTRERIRQMNAQVVTLLTDSGSQMDIDEVAETLTTIYELDKLTATDRNAVEVSLSLNGTTPPQLHPITLRLRQKLGLAEEVSTELTNDQKTKAEQVFVVISQVYGVSTEKLKTKRLRKSEAWAQRVIVYILKEDVPLSFSQITQVMGKSFMVVANGYNTVKRIVSKNARVLQDLEAIRTQCRDAWAGISKPPSTPVYLLPPAPPASKKETPPELKTPPPETPEMRVVRLVAEKYNLTVPDLLGQSTQEQVLFAQDVTYYLFHQKLKKSPPQIATFFKKKASAVRSALTSMIILAEDEPEAREEFDSICGD